MSKKNGSASSPGVNFERIKTIPGSTYRDSSTVIIVPTRGMVHCRVFPSIFGMIAPMNQKRALLFAYGDEVGVAYDKLIDEITNHPEIKKWKYVMTVEDDNIPPPDAHIRLLETIEWGKYDAVSGIYFTKGEIGMPMAYGNPDEYRETGVLEFGPRDIRHALERGHVMDVNGIAMGCALWRMDVFKRIPRPWYQTISEIVPGKGIEIMTQDLAMCRKMRQAGMRLAIDFRVKVGHLDINSGVVY